MQFKFPHANTVTAVAEQVQALQQTEFFFQLYVLIFQVFVALLEVPNQMLLPG